MFQRVAFGSERCSRGRFSGWAVWLVVLAGMLLANAMFPFGVNQHLRPRVIQAKLRLGMTPAEVTRALGRGAMVDPEACGLTPSPGETVMAVSHPGWGELVAKQHCIVLHFDKSGGLDRASVEWTFLADDWHLDIPLRSSGTVYRSGCAHGDIDILSPNYWSRIMQSKLQVPGDVGDNGTRMLRLCYWLTISLSVALVAATAYLVGRSRPLPSDYAVTIVFSTLTMCALRRRPPRQR